MKETSFIQQNKEKWLAFEEEFEEKEKDPEKLSNLFIQLTDDLSYSRTYYPNRSVRIYLNNLAQKVFYSIYKNKMRRKDKLISFWKEDLPKLMYESRYSLYLSFFVFMLAMGIGILSSIHDHDFARKILGADYVSMTEENIQSNDPMKVYKTMNEVDMFFGITLNNLRVAFFTFLLGLVFGAGTLFFILFNGVMVGVFQYFFIERDLFRESFLAIWVHGALEIPAIVIAGAAGLTLGKGWLFPGTYSRIQSFQKSALRGLQIFVGIVPVIILAGFNESFLTRYTETPDIIRAFIIGVEFLFMFYYFIYYPIKKSKKGFQSKKREDELPPTKPLTISFSSIKKDGEVFSESMMLFRKYAAPLLKISFFVSLIYVLLFVIIGPGFDNLNSNQFFVEELMQIFSARDNIPVYIINFLFLLILSSAALFIVQIELNSNIKFTPKSYFNFGRKHILQFIFSCVLLSSFFLLKPKMSWFVFILIFPYIITLLLQFVLETNYQKDRKRKLLRPKFGNTITIYFSVLLFSFLILLITDSGFAELHLEVLKWNVPFDETLYKKISDTVLTVILLFFTSVMFMFLIFNFSLLYFSNKEIITGHALKERMKTLGLNKKKLSSKTT